MVLGHREPIGGPGDVRHAIHEGSHDKYAEPRLGKALQIWRRHRVQVKTLSEIQHPDRQVVATQLHLDLDFPLVAAIPMQDDDVQGLAERRDDALREIVPDMRYEL